MVTIKQLETENFLLKCATCEQPKCSHISFQGIKIPIYCLGSQSLEDNASFEGLSCTHEEDSMLDALLLAQWEDRIWKGSFRYDVTTSEIKAISGRRKFLAQLNEGWSMDYPSKPEDDKICYLWDPHVFDCMKHHDELLFCVASGEKANSEFIPSAAVPNGSLLIVINATPVEYGHVFLVPFSCDKLYQFLDVELLEMAMRVAVEINNHSFRLFYNSSSGASYMCFQACYFPDLLPVELMPVDTIFSDGQRGIRICTVVDYPIKTLFFESTCNIKIMVEVIAEICSHLQKRNMPFNLLISYCGRKLFLFLQQQTLAKSCVLSAWECGGYFLFKSRCEYGQVTEEAMLKRLRTVSLDDEGFQIVKKICCSIASKSGVCGSDDVKICCSIASKSGVCGSDDVFIT